MLRNEPIFNVEVLNDLILVKGYRFEYLGTTLQLAPPEGHPDRMHARLWINATVLFPVKEPPPIRINPYDQG